MTAWGVVCGIRAALVEAGGGEGGLEGVHVAVQGLGPSAPTSPATCWRRAPG